MALFEGQWQIDSGDANTMKALVDRERLMKLREHEGKDQTKEQ